MRAVQFFIFFIDFSSFKLRFLWILHFQKLQCIIFLLHFKWRKKAESSSCSSFGRSVTYSRSICICCGKLLEGKFCKSGIFSYASVGAYQRKRQIICKLFELKFKNEVCFKSISVTLRLYKSVSNINTCSLLLERELTAD